MGNEVMTVRHGFFHSDALANHDPVPHRNRRSKATASASVLLADWLSALTWALTKDPELMPNLETGLICPPCAGHATREQIWGP